MKHVLPVMACLAVLFSFSGCATIIPSSNSVSTGRLYMGVGKERKEVPSTIYAGEQSAEEPVFCMAAMKYNVNFHSVTPDDVNHYFYYKNIRDAAPFRDFRAIGSDRPDPKGCDLLLRYDRGGQFTDLTLQAYSAYSLSLIWEASDSDRWGAGTSTLGRALHASFLPGTPDFETLRKERTPGRRVSAQDVLNRFGFEMSPLNVYVRSSDSEPSAMLRIDRQQAERRALALRINGALAPQPVDQRRVPDQAEAVRVPSAPAAHSDVDEVPSAAEGSRRQAYAVVIGVGKYRMKLPAADYADADARLFSKYLTRVLGYQESNVATLVNDEATKGDFEKYLEQWLPNRVEQDAEVFVYYSGHGAPNPETGEAYLVPYDGDPTYLKQTGYPLKSLYAALGKLPTSNVTVVLDSCFSGAGGRSVLAQGARPLITVRLGGTIPPNVTVLSASAGDQISHGYDDQGHGLFTYFLLKGIKERAGAGSVDMKKVFDAAAPRVADVARRDYNSDQVPQWRQGGR